MDPLSITTGAIALGSAIASSVRTITKFRRDVQGARGDLLRVAGELSSLKITIEGLQEESVVNLPVHMHNRVMDILGKCTKTVHDIEVLLTRLLDGGLLRRMEWAALGRTELDDSRSNLEANKISLNLAIDVIDLSVTQDIKKDTGAVKKRTKQILADTTDIKAGQAQVLQVMHRLRSALAAGHPEVSTGEKGDVTQQKATTKPKSSTKTKSPDQALRKPKKASCEDTIISDERTGKHGEQPRAPRLNKEPSPCDLRISIQNYLDSEKSGRQRLLKKVEAEIETGCHPNRVYGLVVKAVEMAEVDLLRLLLKHGLSTSIALIPFDDSYDTAANYSKQSHRQTTSLLLIACGRHLHFPVFSVEMVALILENGADVNARAVTGGWTPLMLICRRQRGDWKERLKIARLLLDHGAKSDAKTKEGDDCLQCARCNQQKGFERLILSSLPK